MRLSRSVVLLSTVALVAAASIAPAGATDRGVVGTVSPANKQVVFEGPPLAGVYPYGASPREPFANFKPEACRTVPYCDTVLVEVDYPASYLREVFFGVSITLSWENPHHADKNPTGNDVDLFLWGDDNPVSGGPASKCQGPDDTACEGLHPEVITVTEPPNTTPEDAEPAALLLTVVNEKGVNVGYTVTVDWFTFDIAPPPAFTPPERETSRVTPQNVAGPFDFDVTEAQEGAPATPEATPRKLLVPGPDGKLHEVELPIYAAGQRLGTTAERNTAVPWITAGVAGAVALAALIFLLVRRNRRAMEQL